MRKRGKKTEDDGIPADIYIPEVDGCCGHWREGYRHGRDDHHEFGGDDGCHFLVADDDRGEYDVPYGFHLLAEAEAKELKGYTPIAEPRRVHCQHCGEFIEMGKALCRPCYYKLMELLRPRRHHHHDLEAFYDERHDDYVIRHKQVKAQAKARRAGQRLHAIRDGRVYFEPYGRIVMSAKRRALRRNRPLLNMQRMAAELTRLTREIQKANEAAEGTDGLTYEQRAYAA